VNSFQPIPWSRLLPPTAASPKWLVPFPSGYAHSFIVTYAFLDSFLEGCSTLVLEWYGGATLTLLNNVMPLFHTSKAWSRGSIWALKASGYRWCSGHRCTRYSVHVQASAITVCTGRIRQTFAEILFFNLHMTAIPKFSIPQFLTPQFLKGKLELKTNRINIEGQHK
jgi:hypothetical protein